MTDQGHGPVNPWSAYDLSADPVLQAIRAQNAQMIANAESSAQAQREKLLLQYGDPEIARQFGGDTQAQAAEQNPFSILKQLAYGYNQNVSGSNEALNKANLFYSSTRGSVLGDLARGYEQSQASAGQSLQEALSGISSGLLDVRNQAASSETEGLNTAYQNALAFALQYGANPSGKSPPRNPVTQPTLGGHGTLAPHRRRRRRR